MAFRTNTSKAQEGGNSLKPEGDYEVIIDTAEVTRTQSGKDKINIVYIIRNDVQQAYQNGLIFESVWKKKDPNEDDQNTGGFDYGRLMAIADAAKLPDGKEYADLDAFLAELKGKPLRVHLYHDPYEGKVYEKIDKHAPTTLTAVKHKTKSKSAPAHNTAPAPAQPVMPAESTSASDPYPF